MRSKRAALQPSRQSTKRALSCLSPPCPAQPVSQPQPRRCLPVPSFHVLSYNPSYNLSRAVACLSQLAALSRPSALSSDSGQGCCDPFASTPALPCFLINTYPSFRIHQSSGARTVHDAKSDRKVKGVLSASACCIVTVMSILPLTSRVRTISRRGELPFINVSSHSGWTTEGA